MYLLLEQTFEIQSCIAHFFLFFSMFFSLSLSFSNPCSAKSVRHKQYCFIQVGLAAGKCQPYTSCSLQLYSCFSDIPALWLSACMHMNAPSCRLTLYAPEQVQVRGAEMLHGHHAHWTKCSNGKMFFFFFSSHYMNCNDTLCTLQDSP